MISVFIVAPTPIAQAGLHALLSSPEIKVRGAVSAPEELRDAIREADVIVVADEWQLKETGRVLTNLPGIALVVLTANEEIVLPSLSTLELCGWGIVPTNVSASQLQAAVVAAAEGLVTFPMRSAPFLSARPASTEVMTCDLPNEPLTPREREVLELVSQGLPNKLIARRLSISDHTVKFHVSSLCAKLGASSRTDAVRLGLRCGLITL